MKTSMKNGQKQNHDALVESHSTGSASATFVSECQKLVSHVSSLYGEHAGGKPLSVLDKKRAAKLRAKGGETVVTTVWSLWQKYGASLPTVVTGDLAAKLAHVADAKVLRHALEVLLKQVDDDIFRNQSECWAFGTQLYGVLKKIAKTDPNLVLGLAPVEAVFQARKPAATAGAVAPKHTKKKGAGASAGSNSAPATEAPAANASDAPNGAAHPSANGASAPAVAPVVTSGHA